MRDIKFRIWDGKKKEWLGKSNPDGMTWYGFHLVGECMSVQAPAQWALDEGMVVEEYTGLEDSDGKEIYEGDILDVKDSITGERVSSIVVYEHACFFLSNRLYTLGFVSGEDYEINVIGNIHENPELEEDDD